MGRSVVGVLTGFGAAQPHKNIAQPRKRNENRTSDVCLLLMIDDQVTLRGFNCQPRSRERSYRQRRQSETLLKAKQEGLENWRTLQELAGII
jgi:hypothetical protein